METAEVVDQPSHDAGRARESASRESTGDHSQTFDRIADPVLGANALTRARAKAVRDAADVGGSSEHPESLEVRRERTQPSQQLVQSRSTELNANQTLNRNPYRFASPVQSVDRVVI
jgi:hypothetical protein